MTRAVRTIRGGWPVGGSFRRMLGTIMRVTYPWVCNNMTASAWPSAQVTPLREIPPNRSTNYDRNRLVPARRRSYVANPSMELPKITVFADARADPDKMIQLPR